jgi:hypothetical protein
MVFLILEPLVTFVLAGLALFGLLTTLFLYLVGPPEFPVWTMLALSLGFAIALVPYHALIRCKTGAAAIYMHSQETCMHLLCVVRDPRRAYG